MLDTISLFFVTPNISVAWLQVCIFLKQSVRELCSALGPPEPSISPISHLPVLVPTYAASCIPSSQPSALVPGLHFSASRRCVITINISFWFSPSRLNSWGSPTVPRTLLRTLLSVPVGKPAPCGKLSSPSQPFTADLSNWAQQSTCSKGDAGNPN